jgi:hypothetical protein
MRGPLANSQGDKAIAYNRSAGSRAIVHRDAAAYKKSVLSVIIVSR